MRKPIIAGNWKMNKHIHEAVDFVEDLADQLPNYPQIDVVVAPTYLALSSVADKLYNTAIKVAAQDAHWESSGAYTSQISASMLTSLVQYVIIGHSERRAYLAETDEDVNRKAHAILAAGLKPIIAVGESLEQNEAGQTESFVSGQIRAALKDIPQDEMTDVVIAYEPIWAIGTGKSASAEVANDIIGMIRNTIANLYDDATAQAVRIQYGGSVKPNNMLEYMSQPEIDGALIGGASLKISDFLDLIRLAAEAKGL